MPTQKSLREYIDALVDEDGFQTDVTITLTNATLLKIVLALVGSGIAISLVAHLLKNAVRNRQLSEQTQLLKQIKQQLAQ